MALIEIKKNKVTITSQLYDRKVTMEDEIDHVTDYVDLFVSFLKAEGFNQSTIVDAFSDYIEECNPRTSQVDEE